MNYPLVTLPLLTSEAKQAIDAIRYAIRFAVMQQGQSGMLPRFVRPDTRKGIRPARKLRSSSRQFTELVTTRNGQDVVESRPSQESSVRLRFDAIAYDGVTYDVAGFQTDAGAWVTCANASREFRRACKRLGVTQTQCERLEGKNRNGQTATAQNSFYCTGLIEALEMLAKLPGVEKMTLKRTSQAPRFTTSLAPEATAKLTTDSPLQSMYLIGEDGKVKFENVKGKQTAKTITHRANVAREIGTLSAVPRKHAVATIAARNAHNALVEQQAESIACRALCERQKAIVRLNPRESLVYLVRLSLMQEKCPSELALVVARQIAADQKYFGPA